eukprot:5848788-Pleurochrysis_carterae.AAC.1
MRACASAQILVPPGVLDQRIRCGRCAGGVRVLKLEKLLPTSHTDVLRMHSLHTGRCRILLGLLEGYTG